MREHCFQRNYLLFGLMTAVIDNNVYLRYFFLEPFPEGRVRLIADEDLDAVTRVGFAFFSYINSVNCAFWAKIVLPHFQAASAEDSDFNHVYFLADKLSKMPVINVEVVSEFPDAPAGRVGFKKKRQWIMARLFCQFCVGRDRIFGKLEGPVSRV